MKAKAALILGLLAFGFGGLLIWQPWRSGQTDAPNDAPSDPAPEQENELAPPVRSAAAVGPLRENAPGRLDEQRRKLIDFLDSATWQERLAHIDQASELKGTIEDYYGDHPDGAATPYELEFFHLDESIRNGGPYYIYFVTTPDHSGGFPAIVRHTPEGFKVDWECFVEFHDQHFIKFHDSGEVGPQEFCVVLKRASYYGPDRSRFTDIDNFLCYRVEFPYTKLDHYAFISGDDPLAASLDEKVSWGKPPLAAIVRFQRFEFAHGERHLKIVALVADGWYRDRSAGGRQDNSPTAPAAATSSPVSASVQTVGPDPKAPTTGRDKGATGASRKATPDPGESKLPPNSDLTVVVAPERPDENRESIESHRRTIEIDPKYAYAHNNLGAALIQQGKMDEAIESFRRAIELDPDFSQAHSNLGNALDEQGKTEKAIESFRRAIELDPEFSQAHSNLGVALKQQGKTEEAIESFRRAIELDPKYADAHNNLGNALRQQGKTEEAIDAYRRAIEVDPEFAQAHSNLGVALKQQGKTEEAIDAYRRAIEVDPEFAQAHSNLGVALKQQGKTEEAIDAYRRAIEVDPEFSQAHSNLGVALKQQGKTEEAIESFRRAIELDPKYADAHNNLGNALDELDKTEEAIDAYRRAIEVDPEFAQAHSNLGVVLKQQGKTEEAIESYQRAIELDPDDAETHYNLGIALFNQGKTEEAIDAYRRAIEVDPEFALAHNNLGIVLFNQGKTEEAIDAYRRAIEVDPEFALAHNNLGVALDELDKTDEAIESYQRAIELDPDDADAHNNLGAALIQQGNTDEAIESCQRAIELDPKNLGAIANIADVYAKLEQVDRCGVWCVRWGLAKGLADEASLVNVIEQSFRQFKVELPAEEPTDQSIRDYYEANKEAFSATAVRLRTLSLPKGPTTREFADELRGKLVAGEVDFAAAVKQHSDDLAADDGGDRGWVKRGDLRQDLIDVAFALKAGEISAVIEDDSHYRILNTVELREGTPPPLSEVREQIVAKLIEEAQAKRIKGWIEQARKEQAEAMNGA